MRKTEDKERTLTVEADKVKEESLVVAGGRCRKRILITVLQISGDLQYLHLFAFHGKFSSETWVLPIITLLLIVAYSAVAIDFYIRDD